jgi:subtilisin
MHVKQFLPVVAAACFLVNCKKDNSADKTDTDACVTGQSIENGAIIDSQYIVVYNSAAGTRMASSARMADMGVGLMRRHAISEKAIRRSFAGEPGGFVARLSPAEAEKLKSDISIQAVEPDRIIALGTCFTVVSPRLVTWNITRTGYGDGTGKTAWIIDSGIDIDHPDLNVDATRSKSFLNSTTSADDENGHGTHVAGIIGAKNNTIGVLGVASGASLVSLRVLDKDGKGTLSAIIQALAYVNSNAKAGDVVNMSLGEEEPSNILDQAVQSTAARGIYIAIAAGNDNKPAINFSPGRANGTNIYTVSATDSLGNFASFSNYGNDAVDVAAPGVRILSTYSNGRYAILSGTSMAAPHVAGLLLLEGKNIKSSGTAKNDPDGNADPIAVK